MVNEHEAALPAASVAVAFTVVTPFGNLLREDGLETTTTPGQLSVAVTEKLTTAVLVPGSVSLVMFPGHVIAGASASLTVTVNVHDDLFPDASVAVQATVVVP